MRPIVIHQTVEASPRHSEESTFRHIVGAEHGSGPLYSDLPDFSIRTLAGQSGFCP